MGAGIQKLNRAAIGAVAAIVLLHATTINAALTRKQTQTQTESTTQKTTHKSRLTTTHKTTETSSTHKKSTTATHRATSTTTHHTTTHTTTHSTAHSRYIKSHYHHKRRPLTAKERARSLKFHQAFIASSQLRPMAQQLASCGLPQPTPESPPTPMPTPEKPPPPLTLPSATRICSTTNSPKP